MEQFDEPGYACDEWKKDGYVHVVVLIKGLQTSREIVFRQICPKWNEQPTNATVEMVFHRQSLCLTVRGESGALKWQKFQLKIKRLPYTINPDRSYHKVQKDRVVLYLCKQQDKSWAQGMKHGLETEAEGKGGRVEPEDEGEDTIGKELRQTEEEEIKMKEKKTRKKKRNKRKR